MHHKVDAFLASITGFATVSITKAFDLVRVENILQAIILGFFGALGGWLFTRAITWLFEKLKKKKK